MRIRCPHCHNPLEVVDDDPLTNVACPACGSSFSFLGERDTESWQGKKVRQIGQFQLLERVGDGHFGSVWKSRDTSLDRIVAIKLPRRDPVNSEDVEQFLREARAAAQLRHPNIVSMHEVGQANGSVFIVSDFIEGCNLKEWLSGQRLTPREVAKLVTKMAMALHHAHEAGVIHRDLKPGNIMLDQAGEPHLMDFGLARRESGEITITIEGRILGTPAYMPPEQARGHAHQADRRSDVYSLGVVMFEMLTGELPFRGDARMLLVQILRDEAPSLRRLNSHVPRDLETICLKCLQKLPDRRYQRAVDLAEDLTRWLDGRPISARPVGPVGKSVRWVRREPQIASLAAAVLLVTVIGFTGVLWQWQKTVVANAEALERLGEIKKQSSRREQNFDFALEAVDQMLTQLGERQLANNPELAPIRKSILESALKLYERLLLEEGTDVQVQLETARAAMRVGGIHHYLRNYGAASQGYARAIKILEPLHAESPQDQTLIRDLSLAYEFYALTLKADGQMSAALEAFDRARTFVRPYIQASLNGRNHELTRRFTETSWSYAQVLDSLGRLDEAESPLREIVKIAESNPNANNYEVHAHWFQADLANVLKRKPETKHEGEQAELRSIEIIEKAAKKYTTFISTYSFMQHVPNADQYRSFSDMLAERYELYAHWLLNEGRVEEADKYAAEATATRKTGIDSLSQELASASRLMREQVLANSYISLARSMQAQGKSQEAIEQLGKGVETYEALVADYPQAPSLPIALMEAQIGLGTLLASDSKRSSEGLALLRSVRTLASRLEDPQAEGEPLKVRLLEALKNGALQSRKASGMATAMPAIYEALELADELAQDDLESQRVQQALIWCHHNLGDALQFTQQKHALAAQHYEKSRVLQEDLINRHGLNFPRAVDLGWTCQNGGNALLVIKPDAHLVAVAVRGVEMRQFLIGEDPTDGNRLAAKDSLLLLGRALTWVPEAKANDVAKAIEVARTHIDRFHDTGPAWRVLGLAEYRQEHYEAASEALSNAVKAVLDEVAIDRFFLAMALARTGQTKEASKHLDAGWAWVQQHQSNHGGFNYLHQRAAAIVNAN